jgi:hypothetical protein
MFAYRVRGCDLKKHITVRRSHGEGRGGVGRGGGGCWVIMGHLHWELTSSHLLALFAVKSLSLTNPLTVRSTWSRPPDFGVLSRASMLPSVSESEMSKTGALLFRFFLVGAPGATISWLTQHGISYISHRPAHRVEIPRVSQTPM